MIHTRLKYHIKHVDYVVAIMTLHRAPSEKLIICFLLCCEYEREKMQCIHKTVLSRAPLYEVHTLFFCSVLLFALANLNVSYTMYRLCGANRYCVSASRLVWFGFYTSISTLINDRPLACALL